MSNSYLDNLEQELKSEGVVASPLTSSTLNKVISPDDFDLRTIVEMENVTGVKYSDEQREILRHHGNACILACAGSGKALVNGTGVLTVSGYKPIESLEIGDKVFDENGHVQEVLGVYPQGRKRVFKVKLNTGDEIKCCSEHLWTVKNNDGYWETCTTKKLIDANKEFEIPCIKCDETILNNDKNKEYIEVFSKMLPDSEKLIELFKDSSCSLINKTIIADGQLNYVIAYKVFMNGLYPIFRTSNSELVKVLKLIYDFFGGKISIHRSNGKNGKSYEVILSNEFNRIIKSIEKTESFEEMTCIKVSGKSELFMTEHNILTHNTTITTHLIAKRIKTGEIRDVSKLIYTTYSKAGATEMKDRLDSLFEKLGMHQKVQVRTLHSFFLQVLRIFGVTADIIENKDRLKFVREACKDADYVIKDDDLMLIDNLLSYQVNNLLSDKKTIESYINTLDDLSLQQYTQIRSGYANRKAKAGLIDYDDMQSYLYLWLVKYAKSNDEREVQTSKQVRDYCQAMWTDFYIDEAQDVSKIQFAILRAMMTPIDEPNKLTANLVFIGDDDQCLIEGTQVYTTSGIKNIEDIQPWDKVLSGCGHSQTVFSTVDNVSKKHVDTDIFVIKTKLGKTIKGTGNHIGFVKLLPKEDVFYTYLMYRHDFGFRIGTTSGVRAGNRGELRNGIDVRLMQERSDKIWILKTSETVEESKYWEAYYAYKYSIPMYRFVTGDDGSSIPKTSLNIDAVKRLHKKLDTFENGQKLLNDLGMYYEYPHRIPQAEGERCKINHSWFSNKQLNKYGTHSSEISINTSNQEYIKTFDDILKVTDRVSSTKYNYKNARNTSSDIDNQLEIIDTIRKRCDEASIYLEVDTDAKFTENKYMPMPFSHFCVGMLIPTVEEYEDNGYQYFRVLDDEIVSIEREHYAGYVYDLSVPDTRNFVANDIVVHNCIYEWRGSDPSIILSIGPTFDMRTFVLSTNYRCKSEIVDYATTGIKHNSNRYTKDMKSNMPGGDVKILTSEREDLCSLSIAAMNHIKWWIEQGYRLSDIAVLSRNNFHLALLSNMLLREGIYCNLTDDMKLTKSYMYSDIKKLIDISQPCWKSDITQSILWRLCKYMGVQSARVIANFQDSCGLTLGDTLGYLLKTYTGRCLEFDKRLSIGIQADEKMKYYMRKLSNETLNDLELVYRAVTCDDREKCLQTLMYQYKDVCSYMYKSKDKDRSLYGLIQYVNNLLIKDGFDKMLDFLRVTEQFENGRMGVIGDRVTLSTIHSAKGREWKNVIMFACDNVSQPSFDGICTMVDDGISVHDIFENIDEERRLFYVGNTRAKENLLVITYRQPSVFILEALGAKDIDNASILSYAQDPTSMSKHNDLIQSNIFDTNSKYYYDSEKYKTSN